MSAPSCVRITPSREVRGRADTVERVADAHARWVARGTHQLRAVPDADGHHGAVRFTRETAETVTGAAVSAGFGFLVLGFLVLDFLVLDAAGLIVSDHRFIDR